MGRAHGSQYPGSGLNNRDTTRGADRPAPLFGDSLLNLLRQEEVEHFLCSFELSSGEVKAVEPYGRRRYTRPLVIKVMVPAAVTGVGGSEISSEAGECTGDGIFNVTA